MKKEPDERVIKKAIKEGALETSKTWNPWEKHPSKIKYWKKKRRRWINHFQELKTESRRRKIRNLIKTLNKSQTKNTYSFQAMINNWKTSKTEKGKFFVSKPTWLYIGWDSILWWFPPTPAITHYTKSKHTLAAPASSFINTPSQEPQLFFFFYQFLCAVISLLKKHSLDLGARKGHTQQKQTRTSAKEEKK